MPRRIANKIVLAEDVEQQNLVRRYLERCGHQVGVRFEALPAKATGGSGEKYVRDQYPRQVKACRSALGRRASALLVVIVDADMEETQRRASQLSRALADAGEPDRRGDEPIVILVPKRHLETWIRALLGNPVDEVTSYKNSQPTSIEIRDAAGRLYEWTRPGGSAVTTFPPSLKASRPEWRKIPD